MKRIILKTTQSPGDVVMLTACVRELKRALGADAEIDVRTPCPALWAHNPNLTPLEDGAGELIECRYPLIHRSNTVPLHFIHGYTQFIGELLGLALAPVEFRGDIHLAPEERGWMSQVQEIVRQPVPFWIVAAGGKYDFTAKWWEHARWQSVVDGFAGRILFVQVGERKHHHPPLRGVLDLRGKTSLRQLVRLVHHAQGVLCPVTLLMHLAAAVPVRQGMPRNRPCVVVAGGREPMQWEAYPHHQYIHTNGALRCCENGGCWKSRVLPLGDGDQKDEPEKLCVDVVELATGRRQAGAGWVKERDEKRSAFADRNAGFLTDHELPSYLPRCLDMITPEEVARRIELYFEGGVVRYLTEAEALACAETIPALGWKEGACTA
jgi:ADP-heptose:LPS heptosyltransferase